MLRTTETLYSSGKQIYMPPAVYEPSASEDEDDNGFVYINSKKKSRLPETSTMQIEFVRETKKPEASRVSFADPLCTTIESPSNTSETATPENLSNSMDTQTIPPGPSLPDSTQLVPAKISGDLLKTPTNSLSSKKTARRFIEAAELLPTGRKPLRKAVKGKTVLAVLLNGVQYVLNTNARIMVYTSEGTPIISYPDTGSPVSLIDRSTLAKRFPNIPIKTLEDGSQLALQGIGEGPTTNKYVDIPIRCKTTEHEMVEFLAIRVHIVDRLPEGIFLLGLNFIIPNALDFR
jgi:hypothetical protein